MYTNYGKLCRSSKKSSKSSEKSPENEQKAANDTKPVEDISTEDALGDDELAMDKANAEGYAGEEGEGAENVDGTENAENAEGAESSSTDDGETDGEYGEDNEGDVDGDGGGNDEDDDNTEESGSEDQVEGEDGGSSEDLEDEEVSKTKKKRGPLEYDIKHMYPEMNILIQKKKREWDFQDPDIIRALWLESKTNVLSEWKVRNAKINTGKPANEVRENVTFTLRQEHLKNKAELQKAVEEREFEMTETAREPPHFDSIQLATNLTTEMRYKYNRNNPTVPRNYVEHFEKFKKPPFKNNPNTLCCKL